MALTPQERERVRYHLGYLNTSLAGSIQYGLPRPMQTLFVVEQAMDYIIPVSEGRVRSILKTLDCIEQKLIDAQDRLSVQQVGETKLRDGEPDLLEDEYFRWAGRLADNLGVPFYPYSNRFKGRGGVVAGSIPVRG